MLIPERIMELIGSEAFETDTIGKSASSVLLFEDKVLKIRPITRESDNEVKIMRWLGGKLPVPRILASEEVDGKSYLLMSRIPGDMACASCYMEQPDRLVKLLADALKRLWSVDVTDCPVDASLKMKLSQAEDRVAKGMVDVEDAEPDTFGEKGFQNPEALLLWLKDNQPTEELALIHGDYCLPNVFFDQDALSGFIDLGRMGVEDKWCDIALCYDKPHNTDDEDVRTRIAKWAAANSGTEHMFFAVCLGDTVIGYVALNIRENGYEIGYCFHSAYHGKGYAKESHLALIDYMRKLDIKRLTAGTAINNTPSVSLLKSLGFELIETEKVSFYKDADGNDIVFDGGVFELLL